MKKKLLAVLMTGIMAMSFAATTTAVYAKGDDDNTLTVWAWDQNFNIKAMNIAGEQYAKDHEGFKVDVVETSSDDCQTKLTTAANAGDYSTLPDIVLMQDNSYQKYLKSDAGQEVIRRIKMMDKIKKMEAEEAAKKTEPEKEK